MKRSLTDIKRRVRSLLQVAKDPGATGPERETAGEMANQIMQTYGLTHADIPERTVERQAPVITTPRGKVVVSFTFTFG